MGNFAAAGVLLGALLPSAYALAGERQDAAIERSQAAIGREVPDYSFTSAGGETFTLKSFRGKPLLVSLVYTSCADLCPTVIESLASAKDVAEETFGEDSFNLLTVGFDTRNDTPERMRSFARTHNAGGINWHFASMSTGTVTDFAEAVGFDYFASAGGFQHPAQVTVIDQDGKVYSQIYGGAFDSRAVMEPLKSLIYGGARPVFSLAGLGDRIKLFCTVYDPRTGRYYFDYSLIISVAIGTMILAGMFCFLVREFRKARRFGNV